MRAPIGATGRAFIGKIALNAATCAFETSIGRRSTIQRTLSVHGGVVNEPEYVK